MRKALKNIIDNGLIALVYFIPILFLGVASIQAIYNYFLFSERVLNLSIGGVPGILILPGVIVFRSVKKISMQNRVLTNQDKMRSESNQLHKELFDKILVSKWVCDRKDLRFYEVNEASNHHRVVDVVYTYILNCYKTMKKNFACGGN